jgi:hypothetical protein
MLRRRIGTSATRQPLRCVRCHHLGLQPITVGAGPIEKRLRDGRYLDHASASCSNGHIWWSIHPEALRQAREANILAALSLEPAREFTSPAVG